MSENPVSPPDRPASADVPERIGKYDIVRPLGKGAMGVVYHARDSLLDRDVALKVMLRQFATDPEQKHRFEREARAVAKLMHPNVVLVFDLGYHTDRSPYIAMELLNGQDLLQALRQGIPLPLDRKVSIILQVLDGLAHAHQTGIVHRDVKPANIFICQDGTVKIMDFGVARFTAASVTATGIVLGTANYMSPEQVEGVKVDGRSDLFSVGSVLFELVVGRKPFLAESLMKTLYKIAHDEPVYTLPEGAENEALLPILQKALSKNVDERYQTAADFAFALREYLMTAGASAATAAVVTPAAEAVGTELHVREPTIDLSLRAAPMVAPEPAAPSQSSADPTALFKLMREIYLGRKSGHLHFTHGKERRSLLIHSGHILHGTSDVLGEHLGDVLVRYGLLEQPELNQATKIVLKDRKRLGVVLAEQGLMDTERLSNAVSLHVREILFNVAERGDGSYAFEDTGTDEGDTAASKLSTVEMILETARRVQDPSVVSQVLGDLDRVLVASDNPQLRFQNVALTPKEGFVMSRIDGTLTAREVFTIIPLPPEDTERSLFVLLCTGAVEYRTAGAREASGSGVRAARAAAAAAAAGPTPRPPAPPAAPSPAAAPPAAPPAKPAAPPTAGRNEAEAIQGRQLLEGRRQLITNAHEAMATKNHFEFLGVPRTATEAQVKEAYFRLARPLHPDSNRDPGLADLQGKREAAFHRLSQAYETLRDPQKRGRYEADLKARAPRQPAPVTPPPPEPGPPVRTEADRATEAALALESVRQAERLFKEEKYWDAIQLLEPAIPRLERHSKMKAQVVLARAYMKNPNWGRRAEELLQRVVQENPDHADAYVALGNLYRASQLKSRAQAMYRKAVQAQPGHPEALAELATLDGEGPEGGTLLKKFFSKG